MRDPRAEYWREVRELESRVDNLDQFDPRQKPRPPRVDDPIDPSYISVSYDSDLEQFTITVTALPVVDISPVGAPLTNQTFVSNQTVSATLVFDKPTISSKDVTLYAGSSRVGAGGYKIFWDGSATASDGDTTSVYAIGGHGNRFAYILLLTDGTYTVGYEPQIDDRIIISKTSFSPLLWVSTGTLKIRLDYVVNPFDNGTDTYNFSYTAPFDDKIILGFNNNSVTLNIDSLSNSGSYDSYIQVGDVKISATNEVEKCLMFPAPLTCVYGLQLGFTGTGNYTNFRIVNGRIVNAT